ncbi:CLUMA_CG002467, isoform A [Clunio marinus]|uniref:CLUMA_CG002467, isoform A n=1 Tax=Clunio marinus TaxID=568069 RepID=A0A1J1HL02_9DIPT|nr:CLUMA_CG002467, isoform A [Clunio marinus]
MKNFAYLEPYVIMNFFSKSFCCRFLFLESDNFHMFVQLNKIEMIKILNFSTMQHDLNDDS